MQPGFFQICFNNPCLHKQCMKTPSFNIIGVLTLKNYNQFNRYKAITHCYFNLCCPGYSELENLVYVLWLIQETCTEYVLYSYALFYCKKYSSVPNRQKFIPAFVQFTFFCLQSSSISKQGLKIFGVSAPHWKKSCLGPHLKYMVIHNHKTSHGILSKFTLRCWAALTATLGRLWPPGCRLDTLKAYISMYVKCLLIVFAHFLLVCTSFSN